MGAFFIPLQVWSQPRPPEFRRQAPDANIHKRGLPNEAFSPMLTRKMMLKQGGVPSQVHQVQDVTQVGIIIGAAFEGIVTSLVNDVIMPPIGLLLGNVDFSNIFAVLKEGKTAGPYASIAAARAAGAVTMNIGLFINTIINFLIVAFAGFLLIRNINRFKCEQEAPAVAPTTKDCSFCFTAIPIKATRCPDCTSKLKEA
jgi:large conductance mechanosensitive channel